MRTRAKTGSGTLGSVAMSNNLYSLLLPVNEPHIRQATAAKALKLKPSETCPIAVAIREKVPTATGVAVSNYHAHFMVNGVYFNYILPPDAQEFIKHFDAYEYVKPELFRLTLRRNK